MTTAEAAVRLERAERALRAAQEAGRDRDVAAFRVAVAVLEQMTQERQESA